jgi:hypothetical protein
MIIGSSGDISALTRTVYHVAQHKHANDRRRGAMMVKVGTLEATCLARR